MVPDHRPSLVLGINPKNQTRKTILKNHLAHILNGKTCWTRLLFGPARRGATRSPSSDNSLSRLAAAAAAAPHPHSLVRGGLIAIVVLSPPVMLSFDKFPVIAVWKHYTHTSQPVQCTLHNFHRGNRIAASPTRNLPTTMPMLLPFLNCCPVFGLGTYHFFPSSISPASWRYGAFFSNYLPGCDDNRLRLGHNGKCVELANLPVTLKCLALYSFSPI